MLKDKKKQPGQILLGTIQTIKISQEKNYIGRGMVLHYKATWHPD